jgi:acyl carrier protein
MLGYPNRNVIEQKIQLAFESVFGKKCQFNLALTKKDVSSWDSLHHVMLLVRIEKDFGIRFDPAQIENISSILAITECVESSISKISVTKD